MPNNKCIKRENKPQSWTKEVGEEEGDGDGANRRRARELSSKLSALTALFCHYCVPDTRKHLIFFFFSFLSNQV